MCKDVLSLNLTTHNVAGTLILTGLHSAKQFKERCPGFTAERAKDIIHSDGWKTVLQSYPILREEAIIALDTGMQPITTYPHRKTETGLLDQDYTHWLRGLLKLEIDQTVTVSADELAFLRPTWEVCPRVSYCG
jgi:hypothetical protein